MIEKGNKVRWDWGSGIAKGEVLETYDHEVEKEIAGRTFLKRGEKGDKALLIRQEDGSEVLKLESDVFKM